MRLSKEQEAQAIKAYEVYFDSYINGDVKTIASLLDDNYNQIGSAEAEVFYNKNEAIKFLKDTIDQVAGKTEIRNRFIKIDPIEQFVLVTDLFDIYALMETEWAFYAKFRASTLMEQKEDGWKFIHQHSSMPDTRTEEGENIAIEKIAAENQELREAVRRRTIELENKSKELEIETALERVRSVAMSMRKPDDMLDVCQIISKQLESLSVTDIRNIQVAIIDESNKNYLNYQYFTPYSKKVFEVTEYEKNPASQTMVTEMQKSANSFFIGDMQEKELEEFREWRKKYDQLPDPLLDKSSAVFYYFYSIGNGGLGLTTYKAISDTDLEIFKRFHKVFELAYRRFHDIEKAEAQVREAQIEAALERVRARSMAMHKSEELADLSLELVKQVQALGVATWFCAFNIYDDDPKGSLEWGSNGQGTFPKYITPREGIFLRYYEAGQSGETLLINEIGEKECPAHYDYLCSLTGVGEQLLKMKEAGIPFPTSQIDHAAFFKYGYILFITFEPAPEAHDIFKRFAKVFEQTYTRFLDLQKAEEQAREAQIETALEKVRSRTMAMQKGEELKEVVVLLYKELMALGVTNFVTCGYVEINEKINRQFTWVTSPGGDSLGLFYLPLTGDATFDERYSAWKQQQIIFHQKVAGQVRSKHLEYAITTFNSKEAEEMVLGQFPDPCVFYCFNFSHGYLHLVTGSKLKNEEELLLARFTRVFEQTYARFLDLQKAEAQVREAQIEAALEKVRSHTMGMQSSEELANVATVMFDHLRILGGDLFSCGIVLCDKNKNEVEQWHSLPEAGMLPPFYVPVDLDFVHQYRYEQWKAGVELFSIEIPEDKIAHHFELMETIPSVRAMLEGIAEKGLKMPEWPGWEIDYGASFRYGYLLVSALQPFENKQILPRFAKVFEQTYTRFLDLQKAESQAREAQIEAALEKVRSRSIGMQKSEELKEVIQVIHDQLIHLNFKIDAVGFTMDYFQNNDWNIWIANKEQSLPSKIYIPYIDHPQFNYYKGAKEKGLDFFANTLSFEDKNSIFNYMFDFMGDYPQAERDQVLNAPGLAISQAFLKNITLWIYNLDGNPYTEEDNDILIRFARVFEQTYVRFNDLKKAEKQAREAQIEAALERVRSRSMAMHQSNELLEVANVLFQQLRSLGGELWASGVVICKADSDDDKVWFANEKGVLPPIAVPHTEDPTHKKMYDGWKKKMNLLSVTKEGQELKAHYDYMISVPAVKPLFESILESGLSFPEKQTWYASYFDFGYLLTITLEPYPDEEVLVRFAKVFNQAYTRFLDLQKAEAQAREAQVDAALERTRNQSMQMQRSDEIKDLSKIFHEQLTSLNIPSEFSYIWLPEEEKEEHKFWATWSETKKGEIITNSKSITYPLFKAKPYTAACFDAWGSNIPVHVTKIPPEEIAQFFTTWKDLIKGAKNLKARNFSEGIYYAESYMKYGCFGINIRRSLSEEEQNILLRFSIEFERAYTRFLDLKKAEEQTREAQIELALERIRAQVTAMSESADLLDIVVTMRSEFVALGHEAHYFWYMKWHPEIYEKAMTSGDGTRIGMVMSLPRHIHGDIKLIDDWEKSDESTVVFAMDVETAVDYVHKMITLGDFKQVDPNAPTLDDIRHIGGLTFIMARTTHGEIGYSLPGVVPNPPEEDLNILVRFASVFDLAYRRFEDLKSAEQQNRKSQIELALERVRARALAMQLPEELKDVADVLRNEMGKLGIEELETCSIYINDASAEKAECWYALKNVRESEKILVNDYFALNLKDTWVGRKMLKFYQSKDQQVSIKMTGKPRIEWIRYCEEKSVPFRGYYGDEIPDRTYHLYKFSHGAIGVATPESISDENWGLLNRAASVFSLAYSRFKDLTQARTDLQRLKEEKKRAEDALSDLKSTQDQLVHAEKMASLGELTAGIAHEIQNPLNFVNNFSEVNTELIEELKDELKNGELDEVITIADDIAGNEEKIKHHGKRAEAIVKGMLQHSRTTAGEKELTDINELADEFLRLAYHGLRAKDKSFNADFRTELDKKLPKVNVVPQDIGRVLLNLINNAFFTVSDRVKQSENDYKPSVQVSTKSLDDKIEINVKDNGNGVPDNIKEKIFQPFFTTKPTGEGTGLGLSLSYDIITKGHGGEMKVETTVGEGSEFIIMLPL